MMETDELDVKGSGTTSKSRKICEVCSQTEAKYTCPACEVKTCCLTCVNIHKKELDCDGRRNKVKYIPVKKFSNLDLLSDYRFLEETGRAVDSFHSCSRKMFQRLRPKFSKMVQGALNKGVVLHFLPTTFNRHKLNTSYYDTSSKIMFWRIDWVFPCAGFVKLSDERVQDTTIVEDIIQKHINCKQAPSTIKSVMSVYYNEPRENIKLLLRAEKTPGEKYYEVDSSKSLGATLFGKHIVEFPIIMVVTPKSFDHFKIICSEEEENISSALGHIRLNGYSGQNLLFSSEDL